MFYREHALTYSNPQFAELWQSQGGNHNFKKCGGKPKLGSPTQKKAYGSADLAKVPFTVTARCYRFEVGFSLLGELPT